METKKEPAAETKTNTSTKGTALGKQNYYLIACGAIVIIIGFILMSGGKYNDPNVFNGEELYSTRRITVAPIVIILGFLIEIYAIFHKNNKS
jgi:hypothetical protein